MSQMFAGCSLLESVKFSNSNTKRLNELENMFLDCSSLKSLNLSNFNTTQVYKMDGLFKNCPSLNIIDISHFTTKKKVSIFGNEAEYGKLYVRKDFYEYISDKPNNWDIIYVNDSDINVYDGYVLI